MVASVLDGLLPWVSQCRGKVLEVGCGGKPYRHLVPPECVYQGLDHEMAQERFDYRSPDVVYFRGGKFPLPDNSFDFLFHTEVLEHVFDTREFLHECQRVLKPGGGMFFSVPFQVRYHYIPHDYWRFTPAALQILLQENGFYDIVISPRGTDITVASYKLYSVILRLMQGGLLQKLFGVLFSPLAALAIFTGYFSMRLGIGSQDDCLRYNVAAKRT